ncbi:MAG: xanthine dehydrogenase accessory factor [Gammaproteobacteria bacterium]|jgi:xanthine dehydrogenase accessory factor
MKEIFSTIREWSVQDKTFAVATVIKTWGSSPRPIGSSMLIAVDASMVGSVSGGCVEGAVVRAAITLLEKGGGQLLQFGITNEEAWAVGLSCGGKIEVYVERFMAFDERPAEKQIWEQLQETIEKNKGCILVSRLLEGETQHYLVEGNGNIVGMSLSENLKNSALQSYQERKNQVIEEEGINYFIQVFPPKSQLLAIGAAHITVDLVDLAQQFGFETAVIDPRSTFGNKKMFTKQPDQIIEKYPSEVLSEFTLDAYTYVTILSHDPKIDDNALHVLLKSKAAYIGALGSRKTHAKRVARLQEAGFTQTEIDRIDAPIGVDINGKTTREIALSIMAGIIKVKNAHR